MNKKVFFILLAALFFPAAAEASPTILRAPQTSREEFQAFIKTEKGRPYSEILMEKEKHSKKDLSNLLSLMEQAQESFLKDHLKTAGAFFKSITEFSGQKHWGKEAREVIFYAYMRLAQIKWKGENPEVFLHEALLFDPELEPDSKLFPPPLLKKFLRLKTSLPKITLNLDLVFPFHDRILINGREFSRNDKASLYYGSYLVSAVGSSHKTWKKKITASELSQMRVVTASFIGGVCEAPVVPSLLMDYKILFPDFCWWSRHLNSPLKKEKALLSSKKVKEFKNPIDLSDETVKKRTQFIYGGIAAAVSGIILWSVLGRNQSQKPSHKTEKPVDKKEKPAPKPQKAKGKPKANKPTITIGF